MPKILIVEDNQLTRITLERFLRGQGYEVELAEDGARAISLLEEKEFDLVLSDVIMPHVNGWELTDHVNSTAPETQVLLMTAYAHRQSAQTSAGTPEIVLKPLQLTELLAKIRKMLEQKKSN